MVQLIDPRTQAPLHFADGRLVDDEGGEIPVVGGIPRFCPAANYAASFGNQWNRFPATQIDRPEEDRRASENRFFAETAWTPESLDGLDILEVGSGAGRFSRTMLERTRANLWSVDYSAAVEANLANNGKLAPGRFNLFQASIYELPFPNASFDKVFCLGVLQHTPDFEASVRALVQKAKVGGEIVVDFYPIRGPWTKIHAKYVLRPLTKRISQERLLRWIESNADWMIALASLMQKARLNALTRFLPLVNLRTLPANLSKEERREWAVLDTFDMLSPEYDNPQRLTRVVKMFERSGARVTYAEFVENGAEPAPVVRAIRER